MSVLVDAGFYIALQNTRDPHHQAAAKRMEEILGGRHGQAYVSDYLMAEILNYATRKFRGADAMVAMLEELLGRSEDPWLAMLKVDDSLFEAAAELFRSMGARRRLSFTDCTTLVLARKLRISAVASFDTEFDGLVERLS